VTFALMFPSFVAALLGLGGAAVGWGAVRPRGLTASGRQQSVGISTVSYVSH
jgi:hypothetical protein